MNDIGNSATPLILKCNGTVRVLYGSASVDLVREGKIQGESKSKSIITEVDSEPDKDGWYKIGNRILLRFNSENFYFDLKDINLEDLGIIAETKNDVKIKSGIVFIKNESAAYTVSDGILTPIKLSVLSETSSDSKSEFVSILKANDEAKINIHNEDVAKFNSQRAWFGNDIYFGANSNIKTKGGLTTLTIDNIVWRNQPKTEREFQVFVSSKKQDVILSYEVNEDEVRYLLKYGTQFSTEDNVLIVYYWTPLFVCKKAKYNNNDCFKLEVGEINKPLYLKFNFIDLETETSTNVINKNIIYSNVDIQLENLTDESLDDFNSMKLKNVISDKIKSVNVSNIAFEKFNEKIKDFFVYGYPLVVVNDGKAKYLDDKIYFEINGSDTQDKRISNIPDNSKSYSDSHTSFNLTLLSPIFSKPEIVHDEDYLAPTDQQEIIEENLKAYPRYDSSIEVPDDYISNNYEKVIPNLGWIKKMQDFLLPIGSIIMWHGGSEIPKCWHICDGNEGTPNLIDKFIVGGNEEGLLEDISDNNLLKPDENGIVTLLSKDIPNLNDRLTSEEKTFSHSDYVGGGRVDGYESVVNGVSGVEGISTTTKNVVLDVDDYSSNSYLNITIPELTIKDSSTKTETKILIRPKHYKMIFIMKIKNIYELKNDDL